MEPLLSRLPFMTLPGNHETEIDGLTNETFVNYRNRYFMPGGPQVTLPGIVIDDDSYDYDFKYGGGSSYYSFDVGLAHFICLNTYDTHDNSQVKFLEKDLKNVDRKVTPWVFVSSHAPLYNANAEHQDEVATLEQKAKIEYLLIKYEVDAMFTGHVHSYARTKPVANNVVDYRKGITYFLLGDGGNHEGLYDEWLNPLPAWDAYHNGQSYGYAELKIHNRTHTLWEWVPDSGRLGVEAADYVWLYSRESDLKGVEPIDPNVEREALQANQGLTVSDSNILSVIIVVVLGVALVSLLAMVIVSKRRGARVNMSASMEDKNDVYYNI